jgi:hypothetical protein
MQYLGEGILNLPEILVQVDVMFIFGTQVGERKSNGAIRL